MIDSESLNEMTDSLGAPARPLALRLHGGGRDGQMVTIDAKKCWVGSGPSCTLRVDAEGVCPVHCVILHGARHTVVRRLAPDTRLNGRSFIDANLGVGDRLSIGPVEIEVLHATAADTPSLDGSPPGSPTTPELVEGGSTGRQSSDEQRIDPGAVSPMESDRQHLAAATRIDRLRARSLVGCAKELRNRLALLADDRSRLMAEADQLRRAAEEAASDNDQLCSLQHELEERQREFERQKTAHEQAIADSNAGLQAQREALESQRRAFNDERSQSDQQRSAQLAEFDERDRQLRCAQAQLESERTALEQQRETWQLECEQMQQKMHEQMEELRRLEQQVLEFRASLENDRHQWESGHHQQAADFDHRLHQIESKCAALQKDSDGRDDALHQEHSQLEAGLRRLDDGLEELSRLRAPLQQDPQAAASEPSAVHPTTPPGATSAAVGQPVESEEIDFKPPSDQPTVTASDILERLGSTVPASEANEEPAAADESVPDRRMSRKTEAPGSPAVAAPRDVSATEASPTVEPRTVREGDDETIQDYMSRLLARTRGGASPQSVFVQPAATPSASIQDQSPVIGGAGQGGPTGAQPSTSSVRNDQPRRKQQTGQAKRRAPAAELKPDLPAMRELAKLAAQHALDQHARSKLRQAIYARLSVVVTGIAAGTILLIRSGPHTIGFYAGLISLSVAAGWIVPLAAAIAKRHLVRAQATAPLERRVKRELQNPLDADTASHTSVSDEPTQKELTQEQPDIVPETIQEPPAEQNSSLPMSESATETSEAIDHRES